MTVTLINGDCLEVMRGMADKSVDAIITDLPYGTTACKWDAIIPFEPMWEAVKRVLKPRGVFVTTASQPFTSKLVMSNLDWFRYEWVWEKPKATGHLDIKRKPMKEHENICVFYETQCSYHPQMVVGKTHKRGSNTSGPAKVYGDFSNRQITESNVYFPKTIIRITNDVNLGHPTQKPVALYEYLIRTYTNEGDTVLDFCAGSGTTGVAAVKTNRHAILVEKEAEYYEIMQKRIADAQAQPVLV